MIRTDDRSPEDGPVVIGDSDVPPAELDVLLSPYVGLPNARELLERSRMTPQGRDRTDERWLLP